MADLRSRWFRLACGLAVACLLAASPATAQTTKAQAKKAQAKKAQAKKAGDAKKTPAKPGDRAEAAAILRDLRELAEAARADAAAPVEPASDVDLRARLGLTGRVVEPATITPGEIDAAILALLKDTGVAPAKRTTDAEFVRRVYLDLAGTLPEPEEAAKFVRDGDPKKRSKLIGRLLDSDRFATNWARYWRDVVSYRATFEQARLIHYDSLEGWLASQIKADRPWDEIARALIAGTGSNEEDSGGNVVLQAAHNGDPVEVAGEVSRIFLGVQISCAQCHDHPTDPWKREQFHEFAAFFAGTKARRNQQKVNERRVTTGLTIVAQGRPKYTMPDLSDPTRSIPVEPKFFFATSEEPVPPKLTAQQRRELAASYVTGQDSPWFARAFVNRVWYTLMGEAFYNPVDDMGPTREAFAPELLDRLASQWARGGYDVKWLYRTLLETDVYQRQNRSTKTEAGRTEFASACPSRLRGDQVFDAIQQALGVDFEAQAEARAAKRPNAGGAAAVALRRRQAGPRGQINALFGSDPSIPNDEVLGTIPQALFLMNGTLVNRAVTAGRNSMLAELLAENSDNDAAVRALYQRVLARQPTDAEGRTCLKYAAEVGNRREAFEDLLWALINSTEFISRR